MRDRLFFGKPFFQKFVMTNPPEVLGDERTKNKGRERSKEREIDQKESEAKRKARPERERSKEREIDLREREAKRER